MPDEAHADLILKPDELQALHTALLAAFPSRTDLAQLTMFGFGVPLQTITREDDLKATTLELLQWALANGKLRILVQAAIKQNPDSPPLRTFCRAHGIPLPAKDGSVSSSLANVP